MTGGPGKVHAARVGGFEKSIINGVCKAVHVAYPAIPKKVCVLAGTRLAELGHKVDFQSVVVLSRRLINKGLGGAITETSSKPMTEAGMLNRLGTRFGKANTTNIKGGGVPISGMPATLAPVAVSRSVRKTRGPRMRARGDAMIISHSEMLGSIASGSPTSNVTAFRCIGLRANPGISSVFPWLSSVAVNYEKYRFRRLSFTIVPLVATNFSGRIGLGFDYDSTDTPPGNRQEFYALSTHAENMPWEAARVAVKCDQAFKFTGTHVAADNKLIDQGQVILMSDSISNGGTISSAIPLYDLIVDYEVELIEPQQALFATQSFNSSDTNLVAGVPLGTGVDTTTISGPNIVTSTTVTNTVLTFNLPAGTYEFVFMCKWSSGSATTVLSTTTTGATVKSLNAGGTSFGVIAATASHTSDLNLIVTTSGVGFLSNLVRFNVLVTRVSSNVSTNFVV
jgi:hypothetical protein